MLVKCQPPPGQNNSDSNASVCATLPSTHVLVLEFICELAVGEFLGVVNHVTHSAPHMRSCTSQASGLSTVSIPSDETQQKFSSSIELSSLLPDHFYKHPPFFLALFFGSLPYFSPSYFVS